MIPSVVQTPPVLSQRNLVRAATLAPSPDNNQPWRFAWHGDQLLVSLDHRRELPSDVGAMFSRIALGAAIENLCIAARRMGFAPQVEYLDPTEKNATPEAAPVARIEFTEGAETDPLHANLASRGTYRGPYARTPIDPNVLARLERQAAGDDSPPGPTPEARCPVQVDWIADRRGIRRVARLVAEGDRIRFEHRPFHEELYRQLRFSAEEAERARDGLDLRTLALPPGAGAMLRRLRPWSRMRLLKRLGLTRMLSLPSAVAVWRSGAIGVLSASGPDAASYLRGGRAFQRLWLAADAEGLCLHPLGSLPVFIAHHEQLAGRELPPEHRGRAERLAHRFREQVPSVGGRTLLMLFRLGYARPARQPASLRRPVDEVLEPAR